MPWRAQPPSLGAGAARGPPAVDAPSSGADWSGVLVADRPAARRTPAVDAVDGSGPRAGRSSRRVPAPATGTRPVRRASVRRSSPWAIAWSCVALTVTVEKQGRQQAHALGRGAVGQVLRRACRLVGLAAVAVRGRGLAVALAGEGGGEVGVEVVHGGQDGRGRLRGVCVPATWGFRRGLMR